MVIAPVISSRRFTYHEALFKFTAEASDLGRIDFLARAFDDACDQGFRIRSEKTNKEVLFILDREELRGDDQRVWHYRGYEPSYRHLRVTIFND